MLLVIEGMAMCLIMLLTCVVGIAKDGPVGLVTFYEKEVQDRVVAHGLTTKDKIRKKCDHLRYCGLPAYADLYPCHGLWPERCPGIHPGLPADAGHRPDLRPV